VRRLLDRNVEIEPSVWAFLVMFLSIVVDWTRSRALMRVARKYESQAIEADALHFATDVWSSAVVILGLALVWAGRRFGMPQLVVADAIAALGVSAIVMYVSVKLGRRTLDALLDAAPRGLGEDVAERVRGVAGIVGCQRVRVRRAGNRYFVDTIINVDRSLPFPQVKAISDRVEERIRQMLPRSDIMILTQPMEPADSTMFEKVKAVAARHNLAVHDLAAHEINGLHHLELHLEVSDRLTLNEAHDLVSRLEQDILGEVPEISAINTHIETLGAGVEQGLPAPEEQERIEKRLREIVARFAEIHDCHEVLVRVVRGRLHVSCHCTMDGSLPVARVHEITADLETQFKRSFPGAYRLTIHCEPETAD
jgi:divalent metal cation (Fe/Co/Zn/Cd) transporter